MEQSPHQEYRDALAHKIRAERAAGNEDKAKDILEEQKNTSMYADAKDELRNSPEVLSSRKEALERILEQQKQVILNLEAALERSQKETIATTQEEVEDKESSKKGFENQLLKSQEVISVAGHNFTELETDAKSKFQLMNTFEKDTPEHVTAKQDWKDAVKKVEAFETLFGVQPDTSKENSKNSLQQDYEKFVDTGEVSPDIVSGIAMKIKNQESLTLQEQAIHNAKSSDIEAILKSEQAKEESIQSEQNSDSQINKIPGLDLEVTENEHGAPVVYFDGAKESDFDIPLQGAESESVTAEQESNNKQTSKEVLNNIIASARKSLIWMRSKNSAWTTPSMIAREERKINDANEKLKNGNLEQYEDKKTVGAALVAASERRDSLQKKSPQRASWWNRHGKRLLGAAALASLLLFTAKKCESHTAPDDEDTIEVITDSQSMCEYIESTDGYSQVYQKALRNNPDIAQKIGINPDDPIALKQAMENMKVINQTTGEEIRFTEAAIGSEVEFNVDTTGKVTALVHMDTSSNATPERYVQDSFGKTTVINNTVANPFNL